MNQEKQVLSHDPVPGYKPVFYIVLVAAVIYLAAVFIFS